MTAFPSSFKNTIVTLIIIWWLPLFCGAQVKPVVAFEINDPHLFPEGITWNEHTGEFYITSIYRRLVLSIDENGTVRPVPGTHGQMLNGTGIRYDSLTRSLWVNSTLKENGHRRSLLMNIMPGQAEPTRYTVDDTAGHLFNDLVVANGSVFLTDTDHSALYKAKAGKLELFFRDSSIQYPNGIAAHPDKPLLYIASHTRGIAVLDTLSMTVRYAGSSSGAGTTGIDGLSYYNNSLIAVINGAEEEMIVRFFLDPSGRNIINKQIIDRDNPAFDVPTTGVVAGNDFYCIANSQLRHFRDNKPLPQHKYNTIKILKYNLKP